MKCFQAISSLQLSTSRGRAFSSTLSSGRQTQQALFSVSPGRVQCGNFESLWHKGEDVVVDSIDKISLMYTSKENEARGSTPVTPKSFESGKECACSMPEWDRLTD